MLGIHRKKFSLFDFSFRFAGLVLLLNLAWPLAAMAKAGFEQLQFNPSWYRTYDSNSTISTTDGSLLFNWTYGDSARQPDSFYVGIDTLWILPRDIGGDTTNNWDLQVCPDGFCMNGVNTGVFGADAPLHFGDTGDYGDTSYQTEHHFQFFPAISASYKFTAPDSSVVGGMMFVQSRSTGAADTVFGFGAWNLPWDSAYPPPLHPVKGYLPKRSDFTIVDGMVRYLGPNTSIRSAIGSASPSDFQVRRQGQIWVFSFAGLSVSKRVELFGMDGKLLWRSDWLADQTSSLVWNGSRRTPMTSNGFVFARLEWRGGSQLRELPFMP